jgi:hypothetical protein
MKQSHDERANMASRTQALLAKSGDVIHLDFRQLRLPLTKPRKTREERFFEKVDRSAGPSACHPWLGAIHQADGYGEFSDVSPYTGRRTMRAAHRVAWELANGRPLRRYERVLHARGCTKTCCNPLHLRVGSAAENSADARAEGRLKGAKLDADQVRRIVALRNEMGLETWALAERFSVSHQTINSILKGKTWGRVTGIVDCHRKTGRPKLRLIECTRPIVRPAFVEHGRAVA